jgi:hypothetical protein
MLDFSEWATAPVYAFNRSRRRAPPKAIAPSEIFELVDSRDCRMKFHKSLYKMARKDLFFGVLQAALTGQHVGAQKVAHTVLRVARNRTDGLLVVTYKQLTTMRRASQ